MSAPETASGMVRISLCDHAASVSIRRDSDRIAVAITQAPGRKFGARPPATPKLTIPGQRPISARASAMASSSLAARFRPLPLQITLTPGPAAMRASNARPTTIINARPQSGERVARRTSYSSAESPPVQNQTTLKLPHNAATGHPASRKIFRVRQICNGIWVWALAIESQHAVTEPFREMVPKRGWRCLAVANCTNLITVLHKHLPRCEQLRLVRPLNGEYVFFWGTLLILDQISGTRHRRSHETSFRSPRPVALHERLPAA